MMTIVSSAQNVYGVEARQTDDIVEISYYLDEKADITIWLSQDGGITYAPLRRAISGDMGENVHAGKNKILWNLTQYGVTENMYRVRFKIEAKKKTDNSKMTYTVNGISFTMISVQGGTFTMGGTSEQGDEIESNEKPKHKVTLSDYYIGQTEVTQELWEAVMGTTVREQRDKENRSYSLKGEGDKYPMYYINLWECQQFVKKLNSLLYRQLAGKTFKLPTEAQWEFAARGGTKSQNYKYSGSNTLDKIAWYSSNSRSSTHSVGVKSPNELGIYDMSGNVCEWCSDWYGPYKGTSQTDPVGASSGTYHVYRGGSWYNSSTSARVSYRVHAPETRYNYIGMRLVLQ